MSTRQGPGAFEALQRGLLGDDAVEANRALAAEARAQTAKTLRAQVQRDQVLTGLLTIMFLAALAIAPAVVIAAWTALL